MRTSYYRIQSADRDVAQLIDPEFQHSYTWHRDEDYKPQVGVSVCESREDLAAYLATAGQGIPFGDGDWVIVELTGEQLPETALDAEFGELLIRPTEVIHVAPIDDEFFDMIGAHFDSLEG